MYKSIKEYTEMFKDIDGQQAFIYNKKHNIITHIDCNNEVWNYEFSNTEDKELWINDLENEYSYIGAVIPVKLKEWIDTIFLKEN